MYIFEFYKPNTYDKPLIAREHFLKMWLSSQYTPKIYLVPFFQPKVALLKIVQKDSCPPAWPSGRNIPHIFKLIFKVPLFLNFLHSHLVFYTITFLLLYFFCIVSTFLFFLILVLLFCSLKYWIYCFFLYNIDSTVLFFIILVLLFFLYTIGSTVLFFIILILLFCSS